MIRKAATYLTGIHAAPQDKNGVISLAYVSVSWCMARVQAM
jgi:hypothetical protein